MKFWKKVTCMALCATMSVGAFTACGDKGDNSAEEQARREKAVASAKGYVDTVSDTLEAAKSFTISGEVSAYHKGEYFAEGTTTIDPEETEEESMKYSVDITVTEDGDSYAMMMTAAMEEVEVAVGGVEVTYQGVFELIVKDNFAYNRAYMLSSDMTAEEKEEAKGLWTKMELTLPEEMPPIDAEFVAQLLKAKELKEFTSTLVGSAQEIIAEKFFADEVANGAVAWTKNYAPDMNSMLAFFEGIDETKETLGQFLNKLLAKIDPTLTVESVLDTVEAYKTKTVAQALDAIDAELAKKNTSLQGIFDAIVNSEFASILLTSEKSPIGMPADNFAALKEFKIASIKDMPIDEEGTVKAGDLILGDLINMIIGQMDNSGSAEPMAESGEATDYLADGIQMVRQMLQATLADLEMEMPDCEGVVINDMTVKTGLKLNAAGDGLETMSLGVKMDVKNNAYDYYYDSETDTYSKTNKGYEYTTINADLTVSNFLTTTVTVTAPAADKIDPRIVYDGYFGDDGCLKIDAEKTYIDGSYMNYAETGNLLYGVEFYGSGDLEYGKPITVKVNYVFVYGSLNEDAAREYFANNEVFLTLTLNADGTYAMTGLPTNEQMTEWYNNQNN